MHLGEHLQRASGLGTDLFVVIVEGVDEWLEAGPLPQDPQLPHRPLAGASAGMAGQRLQQRGKSSGPNSPLGTMTNPLHGLVQIPSRDPLEDRHHGPDPAPLPDDVGRGEQTIRVVLGLLLLPGGGITVGKRRDRTDRREEGVLIQHPQLGPVTLDPLRWGLLHHDPLTTTSMTATEK